MADVDISDLPAPPVDISDLPVPPPRVPWAQENLAGPTEIVGGALAGIPHAAAHSAVDIYRRLTGGDTSAPDPAVVQALEPTQYLPDEGAGGRQLMGDIKDLSGIGGAGSPIDAALRAQHEATTKNPLSESTRNTAADVINQTAQVAGDVGNLAPVVGAVGKGISALTAAKGPSIAEAAQAAADNATGAAAAPKAAPQPSQPSAPKQIAAPAPSPAAGTAPAKNMLSAFEAAHPVNPSEPAARLVNGNTSMELHEDPFDPAAVHLQTVQALTPGQGHGTAALKAAADMADQHGVSLTLDANPLDKSTAGIPPAKLQETYAKLGFQPTGTDDNGVVSMRREPAAATRPVDIDQPTGKPFSVLSAERSELTPEENATRTQQLGQLLKASGMPHEPTAGQYKYDDGTISKEPSYAVQTPNANAKMQAQALANHFNQESILHVDADRNGAFHTIATGAETPAGKWAATTPEDAAAQSGSTRDADGQHYILKAPEATPPIPAATPPTPTPPAAAQAAANATAAPGNAGAAATAVDASKLTPHTQAELARLGTANPTALSRIAEAESLPIPMAGERGLTEGQATGDAGTITDEFNRKTENNNAIGNRYDNQDQGLKENLGEIHRSASPLTVANDEIQNGQATLDSLKRYDQPKVAEINAAYKDANDSNVAAGKGALTLDPKPAVAHADTVLEDRQDLLPAEGQTVLGKLRAASDSGTAIPLKQLETWKTTIARATRKYDQAGDTNAVSALSDFRDSLEQMQPSNAATSDVAAKFTKARALAKARFDEIDADPAYKAAVGDETPIGETSPLADKFNSKYIMGGSKAALQKLRPKLDEEGSQAVTSSAMNFLQKKAGINPDTGAGNFSSKGYNDALTAITPRAKELLGNPDAIEDTRKLGNVANYTQAHSRGTSANYSGTASAMMGHLADSTESVINVATHGVPVATWARKFYANRTSAARSAETLKPGAGLEP
jgi:hypothetical protein